MRTVQEILDSMSPKLRKNAMQALEESSFFAASLAQVSSPSALNGKAEILDSLPISFCATIASLICAVNPKLLGYEND
ncbi:hypothetical protein CkP1_0081 [Citrobacter phage CkP1]|nr:hypothetical protein CkP1_0081 [Citrobacter phage CkP1]